MANNKNYKNLPLWDNTLSPEERLDYLLGELTLEEKLQCLGTGCPRIERLGIEPFFVGCEGAHGLQMRHDQSFDKGEPQPTTIFPNPIGMSASWDTDLIRRAGEVVGMEARAVYEKEGRRGGLCLWAPTVDMERDPRWGRTEEAYGEDPFLTGKMASAYIQGMRGNLSVPSPSSEDSMPSSGKMPNSSPQLRCGATLKHFYANNVEEGRVWKSSSIDPRNKYEYYLEPFRRAVVEGGAEGIMTSYNEINGVPAILNQEIQKIAKDQWGLHHVVCDGGDMTQTVDFHEYFGSYTETVAAGLKAGMDCFTDDLETVVEAAREALELGLIEEADIDRALRCHFGTMLRLGIFDEEGNGVKYGLNLPEYQEVARSLTEESVVLLKNDAVDGKSMLPLCADEYMAEDVSAHAGEGSDDEQGDSDAAPNYSGAQGGLAVIGPCADEWFMDWYSGIPPYHVSPLEGIQEMVGGKAVFESGIPRIKLACGDLYLGLLADGRTLGLVEERDAEVFEATLWDKEQLTLRAMSNGMLLTTEDGRDDDGVYRDGIVTASRETVFGWFAKEAFRVGESLHELTQQESDGLSLAVGSKFQRILTEGSEIILKTWNHGDLHVDEQNRIRLREPEGFVEEGEPRRVVYRTLPALRPVLVYDGVRAAKELAAQASAVVFVGGAHPIITCKEETDRKDIDFPPFQRELLRGIYQENKKTVLALVTSVPFAVTWEEEHLPAILTMAGGSMELGRALAAVIFGAVAPAGRLNMTWYRDTKQLPDIDDYDIIQGGRTYQYFQGEVLYPFGYGLTYAQTEISGMQVSLNGHGQSETDGTQLLQNETGPAVEVSCIVRNCDAAGGTAAAQDEVVQLYVAKKCSAVKSPIRKLVGFERVKALRSGEECEVHFAVPLEELRYYDTVQRCMLLEPGEYEFQLGRSSQDIAVSQVISLEGQPRGQRDGSKWQPADHYDRSRNSYLWEGHLGYDSVAHHGHFAAATDLFEQTDGLWQNVNEVTIAAGSLPGHDGCGNEPEGMAGGRDDSLNLEYDDVCIPPESSVLVVDADAEPESEIAVYFGGEHIVSYTVPEYSHPGGGQDNMNCVRPHGRIFREHTIELGALQFGDMFPAGRADTLRLRCQGDIKICRWRFL